MSSRAFHAPHVSADSWPCQQLIRMLPAPEVAARALTIDTVLRLASRAQGARAEAAAVAASAIDAPPSALSHPSVGRYQPLRDCRVVPDGKSSTAADLKTSGEITHLLFPVIRGVPRWMPPNSLLSRSFAARRVRASRADPQSETSGHRRCFVPRGIRGKPGLGTPAVAQVGPAHPSAA